VKRVFAFVPLLQDCPLAPHRASAFPFGQGPQRLRVFPRGWIFTARRWRNYYTEWTSLDLPYDAAHHDGGFSLPAAK
jgi:hypothetical protein